MIESPKGSLMERITAGPVLMAEGYLFEVERRGYLEAGTFVPEVVLDDPGDVAELRKARGGEIC